MKELCVFKVQVPEVFLYVIMICYYVLQYSNENTTLPHYNFDRNA